MIVKEVESSEKVFKPIKLEITLTSRLELNQLIDAIGADYHSHLEDLHALLVKIEGDIEEEKRVEKIKLNNTCSKCLAV